MLPSRYGFNPHHLVQAQAVEVVVGQGAKPGTGGLLMGVKVLDEIADMRDLPQRRRPAQSRPAIPDWLGPDDLAVKIEQLREATDWSVPIHVKLGACRVDDDVKLAAKAGADAIVIDSMVAGTGASAEVLIEHSGIPTVPAIVMAREALRELGLYGKGEPDRLRGHPPRGRRGQSPGPGRRRRGRGHRRAGGAQLQQGDSRVGLRQRDRRARRAVPPLPHRQVSGGHRDPGPGPDPKRLDPDEAAERVANYLNSMTMEMALLTRSLGKSDVHSLEPEDLAALTIEASAMAQVPLAGTNKVY